MQEREFFCDRDGLKIYVKEFMDLERKAEKIPAIILSHGFGGASYDVQAVPEEIVCPGGMHISRRYHENVVNMEPFLEISKYKGRVLVIHGKKDDIVPYAHGVKAKQCYEEGQCKLISVEDAGHGFNEQQDESAMVAVEHFLNHKREYYKPEITTDSKELAFLEETDLTATLEGFPGGLTVRIFG